MDTPTLRRKAKNLRSVVGQYNEGKSGIYDVSEFITAKNIYIIIPIIVFILLGLGKPEIIMDDDDEEKISKSKLILYWMIFSFMLMLGYFGYNYKRENEK